jgi:peptidoglycan/xylan/chitin deacetylase (PgdA/CDA1 family)/CelD/BcsL family acetyltransferase involved in cellulose biosynthesis
MKVTEIRDARELAGMREEWNALLGASGSDTIFLSWEWASAWWQAYGVSGELRILKIYDDAGVLRGIAPLRASRIERYRQTVDALQFVGYAPSDCDSDYLDFISAPGYEQAVMEALGRYWQDALGRGAVLLLHEIPETSPNLPPLDATAQAAGLERIESDVACSTVKLPETWDAYLAMLKPRFRTKVRSVLRNLEAREEIRFGFCQTSREVEELLPVLYDLHARRWQAEHKPGVFGDPRKRRFYTALSALLLERGWLRFSWLEFNGQVLACQYGFAYKGVYFQLQEGYEPDSEHWNVGVGLRAWSMRQLLAEGIREYDFMAGTGRHKSDWGSAVKQSKRILLARPGAWNLLFLRGPEWDASLRRAVKSVLPEKVAARVAAAPGGIAALGQDVGWMRQAAAEIYVRSGMPQVTRRLRGRYQVEVAPNGVLPKLSWKKRTEGAARVFYYHRVNDENDPFFDAISTSLFEEHVRFLARNYQVVSLGEMMQYLEEGRSTDTVVAITFDDGYRDNYEKAFPILKRYGVPATIFLTTGSLDSGEPLWFERLAEAIKHTTRETLDLEIDIPRRVAFGSTEERLAANKTIFACLRRLSDEQRRVHLEAILAELGESPSGKHRNKMLSWDEVRLMNRERIDFGGHTVTHPFLSKLAPERAAWEITECKRRIEEELQGAVDYFAYPNGREEDFAQTNKDLLRAAGYRGALTTIWGLNYRNTDRMEMRRGGPWENSAALFAYKLDWYQLTNQ